MTGDSPDLDMDHYVVVAKRFLHTAVVVDDEARLQPEQPTPLTTPGRRNRSDATEHTSPQPSRSLSLDAAKLSQAFAEHGMVCGVLVPAPHDPMTETVVSAAARADVVILDWQLGGDNGAGTLGILARLRKLDEEHGDRIRIVVIYTGEPDLRAILRCVGNAMPEETKVDEGLLRLRYRNYRVMLFGKNPELLPEEDRRFAFEEDRLPEALIRSWISMDAGVLSSLVLLSVAAVRENAHAVLAKFRRGLDPAFMTHRACLPVRDDAEQHVVDQVASEFRALMAERVDTYIDAHRSALAIRVRELWGTQEEVDMNGQTVRREDVIGALTGGEVPSAMWSSRSGPNAKRVQELTRLFSGCTISDAAAAELDLEFTWLMTSRTVRGSESRTLHLGVMVEEEGEDKRMLLCLMPRCDSLRLKCSTRFLFSPLRAPDQPGPQLVVRRNGRYIRTGVSSKTGNWQQIPFDPNADGKVVAQNVGDSWWFTASGNGNARRFRWLGELRMEWAQHLAHTLGTRITGVAVNTPEWLRRQERS